MQNAKTRQNRDEASEPAYPVGSVGKAIELLRLFDHPVRPVRLGQASQSLGIAPSTVHRMLSMLQKYGYVRQNVATKAYFAGERLLEQARSLVQEPRIADAALPELQRLSERTEETAYLAVLNGSIVNLVACVESRLPLRAGSEVGQQFTAHGSASGKAILAVLPEAELRDFRPNILSELAEVRRRGYAVRVRSTDGIYAIASAVVLPPGAPRAALSLAVPANRVDAKRRLIVRELRRSCERLTALLSSSPVAVSSSK
jgi:DNA-binding IclR family transcriptional regulator